MFDQSFSFILTIAALVVGFMLFTGHGSFFMKGGNTQARAQKYDEKKMEKVSGICLILIGASMNKIHRYASDSLPSDLRKAWQTSDRSAHRSGSLPSYLFSRMASGSGHCKNHTIHKQRSLPVRSRSDLPDKIPQISYNLLFYFYSQIFLPS